MHDRKRNTVRLKWDVPCDPFKEADDKEFNHLLMVKCMSLLDGRQREVVELYVSGMTVFTHIAAELGISDVMVGKHFRRAIIKMRKIHNSGSGL